MKKMYVMGLLTLCSVLWFGGCSTLGSDDADEVSSAGGGGQAGDSDEGQDGGQVIVQQIGNPNPVLSPYNRGFWLARRDSGEKEGKVGTKHMFALLATGEWDAAVGEARQYLASHPGHKRALTVLVAALVYGRKFDLAAYYAKQLEKVAPNSSEVFNIKGISVMMAAQNRLVELRRAEKLFRQALDASSSDIAAGLNLGHLYLEIGDARAANLVFDSMSSRCNSCVEALIGVGISSERTRQYEKAGDAWNQILKENPSNHRALYHLALIRKNGYNDYDQAENILKKLLKDDSCERLLKERAQVTLKVIANERRVKMKVGPKGTEESVPE